MLVVKTTLIKKGWLRRNGVPESELATLTEFVIRTGEVMTRISSIVDPVYLTEPLVKSEEFVLNLQGVPHRKWLFKCKSVVEVVRPEGEVPHYLPGANPYLMEYRNRYKLSAEMTCGDPALTYPQPAGSDTTRASTAAPTDRPNAPASPMVPPGEIRVLPVSGQVYVLVSAEGNMVVHAGTEGVLVVDTLPASLSGAVLAAIRTISDKPIHFILNTQAGKARTGGTRRWPRPGPRDPTAFRSGAASEATPGEQPASWRTRTY
jgi:hypothetical protein